ncbi:MAG TPA: nuclear transport factor 2 family protein [Urbifossiella sp.]|nr:nuclear transport factor 2 family protein [Urbifossiella sp.]
MRPSIRPRTPIPFAGSWSGKELVLGAIRDNFSLVEDQHPVVESVVAQGDSVVVLFDESGRVRATDRPYRVRCVQVFTFRDGRLARMQQVAALGS